MASALSAMTREPSPQNVRLRVELLGEREIPVEAFGRGGLGEEAPTLG
jgi:hypothetical protein